MKRLIPDTYTLLLIGTVVLASFLPASGAFAVALKYLTTFAIALLFFLHGAKLPRQAIIDGVLHWRLHALILSCTFVFFPIIGFALRPVLLPLVSPELYLGVLYMCMLPATVQSAVALTSIAGGNVSASVCSASVSTLLGVFITPFLVNTLVVSTGDMSMLESAAKIFALLLLPFLAGHFLRPFFDNVFRKAGKALSFVDRGSILLVMYSAFSAAVVGGLWQQVSAAMIAGLVVISLLFLALSMAYVYGLALLFGFSLPDRITALFGGAQKSLASGVPMAQVLFAAPVAGIMVLPLMLFHLLQLIVSAAIAQNWHRQHQQASQKNSQKATA